MKLDREGGQWRGKEQIRMFMHGLFGAFSSMEQQRRGRPSWSDRRFLERVFQAAAH